MPAVFDRSFDLPESLLVDGFQDQHSFKMTEYLTHSCDRVVDVK